MNSSLFPYQVTKLPKLIDRSNLHDERGLTGRLLLELADDPHFNIRQHELQALARAVAEGGDREAIWHGIDLQRCFTPETTIRLAPRTLRWLAGAVGALAGIVVFLPVAWTWWSLHRATEAYYALLARGLQAEGASFLQLWTTGFENELPKHLWLSDVAQGAVILIAASVVLIVLERIISRWADRIDDDEYQICASRLAQALNYASLTINSSHIQDPIQGIDLLTEAARELLKAHQQTRESAALLRQATAELDESSTRVTSNLKSSLPVLLDGFRSGIDGTVASFDKSIKIVTTELLKSANSVSEDFNHSIVKTSGALETSVVNAAAKLSASASQVATASGEMEAAANATATAQLALASAASNIESNVRTLDINLRSQLKEMVDTVDRQITVLGKTTGEFSDQVADNTKEVSVSLMQHTLALQHQISELTQTRAAIQRLIAESPPVHAISSAHAPGR